VKEEAVNDCPRLAAPRVPSGQVYSRIETVRRANSRGLPLNCLAVTLTSIETELRESAARQAPRDRAEWPIPRWLIGMGCRRGYREVAELSASSFPRPESFNGQPGGLTRNRLGVRTSDRESRYGVALQGTVRRKNCRRSRGQRSSGPERARPLMRSKTSSSSSSSA
jgi:hypothetical protein